MIVFSLCYEDSLFYREIGDLQTVTFGSGTRDTVMVQKFSEGQIGISRNEERMTVTTRPPFETGTRSVHVGELCRIDRETGTKFYSSRKTGLSPLKLELPFNGVLRVGRRPDNDVQINLPFVSGRHMELNIAEGTVRIADLDSSNGLFLNGTRVRAAILQPGDVLNILTVCIRFVNGELWFENVGDCLHFASSGHTARQTDSAPRQEPFSARNTGGQAYSAPRQEPSGARHTAEQAPPIREEAPRQQESRGVHYRLSPRFQDELPSEPIILDRPPKKGQEYHPSGSRLASMLSMGAMAGASLAMGSFSPALAFARAISLGVSAYNMVAGQKMEKKRVEEIKEYNRRRDEEYRTYIEAQRARIMEAASEQRRIITEENPTPEDCLKIAGKLDRRLWERTVRDRDFLDVRLGMGYEDLCVPIKNYAENRGLVMEDDELEALCNQIAEENRVVDFIPARIALRKIPTIGVLGDRNQVVHQVRNMVIAMTTQHSSLDVKVVGIFDNEERSRWSGLRWLPHIWDDSQQYRYLAFDKNRAHHLCELLTDTLKRRTEEKEPGGGSRKEPPLPHYVILLGSRKLVEHEPLLELLGNAGPELGVSTLFLFDDVYYLPAACGHILDFSEKYPSFYEKHRRNKRYIFSRDDTVGSVQFGQFTRNLAAVELEREGVRSALPSTVTFLEGMGAKTVEDLDILGRWKNHQVTDSLAAPIGVLASGKPFFLDIHYKAHGAHGLLAGTTGSGKSELLRSWILSMAVNYHPREVNFVIIDYKGGGMANKLEALPHVVGKITNIDNNINRSLVSLKQEAKRRMKLLENYPGVDDVDQYMQLYYSGKTGEAMPHLIIVSDEFAELKKEEPEFMKELSTLARVGRSVGIHLVLATQRPSGLVDDQIDSNSRFRICMKVNSVQDSKDILKRPDAAGITQRGRAYVRIGEDELFDLFQSYWSGAQYVGSRRDSDDSSGQVSIVDISGERLRPAVKQEKQQIGSDQLTAIVDYIVRLTKQMGLEALEGPWKPELPDLVTLDGLGVPAAFDETDWRRVPRQLRVPIGIYDRPAAQEQGVQYLDFDACAHYGIFGGPASGKTTLLKTMILSTALQFPPEDVNFCILDFGGRSLGVFSGLPHTAAMIQEDEEEKLWDFVAWLQSEMARRKQVFVRYQVSGFAGYRRVKQDMPAIIVVIDNLLRLNMIYDNVDPFLLELSISGSDCGVHLVFTSNNVNKTNMSLRANVGGNIALRMPDRNDYIAAVSEFPEGSSAPATPGRGLIRDAGTAEFQTAVFLRHREEQENMQALQELMEQMRHCRPETARSQPSAAAETVTEEGKAETAETEEKTSAPGPAYTTLNVLPLGIDYRKSEPVYMDLHEKYSLLLAGSTEEETAALMLDTAKLLLTRPENRLYILDGAKSLGSLEPQAEQYAADASSMTTLVKTLLGTMQQREEQLISGGSVDFDSQICLLITGMSRVMDQLEEEEQTTLTELCRGCGGLGMIAAAAGCCEELRTCMYLEELTIAFVDYPLSPDDAAGGVHWQKGVCVGGKLSDHDYFLQTMVPDNLKHRELAEGDAMVFDCGQAIRIKRS